MAAHYGIKPPRHNKINMEVRSFISHNEINNTLPGLVMTSCLLSYHGK